MIVTETPVKGYAHCRDAMCPGYAQVEVDALAVETAFTYGDHGGDGIFAQFVETSTTDHKFADASEAPCPACSVPREVTGSPRPQYQNLSNHDPMGLVNAGGFDPNLVIPPGEDKVVELEAKLRAQTERMDALIEALSEQDAA